MFHQLFNQISNQEKAEAIENLFTHSAPNADFFLMITLSVLMATFGLILGSSAILVGSMLIAPLLYPILGLAMGISISDASLVFKAFKTLFKATLLSIAAAGLATLLFASQMNGYTDEILARTHPSLLLAAVGIVAGLAAAFAMVKPKVNEAFPGIAISVALIPPLSVVGIGLAQGDVQTAMSSLLLFLVNVVGVVFSAVITFSLMNFYVKRRVAQKVVKNEENKIENEIKKARKPQEGMVSRTLDVVKQVSTTVSESIAIKADNVKDALLEELKK